jgi:hypothetical protein
MIESVEIGSLDLRYESCRMKNAAVERGLLASISEHGVREALQGADAAGSRVLLDGFKRYRCAKKLRIGIVPYLSLGADEALAIIRLLQIGNSKNLNILEQARLIEELRTVHKMCVWDIANLLERSKSWVSVRSGLIIGMSECVLNKIFAGEFPVYAYMYTLRRFMRVNGVSRQEVDEFVASVAGQGLSLREIETLAHGYFKGPPELREQIQSGDIAWGLKRIKEASQPRGCNEFERSVLRDLEIVNRCMEKLGWKSRDKRLKSNSFYAEANLLAGGILKQMERFSRAMEALYDRSGRPQDDLSAASDGDEHRGDRPPHEGQPQHGSGDRQTVRKGA